MIAFVILASHYAERIIAYNHIFDHGDVALLDTLGRLDRKAIGHFGAGRNIDEARECYILEMLMDERET